MKKLSKEMIEKRSLIAEKLRDLQFEIESKIDDYNAALCEASEFVEEVVSQIDDYVSEKSEKWQENNQDKYDEWKSEYENFDIQLEICMEDFMDADEFENLPEEVGE